MMGRESADSRFRLPRFLFHVLLILAGIAALGVSSARAGGHGSGEGAVSPYVPLGDLTVSVFGRMKIQGQLIVNVTLEVSKPIVHRDVHEKEALLRDAYFQSLTRFASHLGDVRRPIDFERLSRSLQKATDKVLGSGSAHVLIASAAVQRL